MKTILGFIGITHVSAFYAEGTAIPGIQETLLQKAMDSVEV